MTTEPPDDVDLSTDTALNSLAQELSEMVGWHFRIRHRSFPDPIDGGTFEEFDIVEAFVNRENKPIGWTLNGMRPYGTTIEELKDYIGLMMQAFDRPVIEDTKPTPEPETPLES